MEGGGATVIHFLFVSVLFPALANSGGGAPGEHGTPSPPASVVPVTATTHIPARLGMQTAELKEYRMMPSP